MRTNKFSDHLLVLPEDDANREIANGFLLDPRVNSHCIQVLPVAGGWVKALEQMYGIWSTNMQSLSKRRLLVLIDFDDDFANRWRIVQNKIPPTIRARTYVLGTASNPEKLCVTCGLSRETIGQALANECAEERSMLWSHDLLAHNQGEMQRLAKDVKSFLFSASK